MHPDPTADPALTVAIALAAGMFAQALGRHLRVPGIVLLLALGVLLGPDVIGIVQPSTLGSALHTLVGFAVAVILFEGGLNLDLKRLRGEATAIRQLVTAGAAVTAVGGALCARLFLGWGWEMSALFGSLVIVTGPTVIQPLLRRIKVRRSLAVILEAEGVLVDAVGAIVAVVVLEVVLSPVGDSFSEGATLLASRLGLGTLLGAAAGMLLAFFLRFDPIVPEGFENVFTLSYVVVLYQASNAWMPESGIVAVVAAGIVVGNVRSRVLSELKEFKEQLTILFIGMLFVLLAADVRLDDVLGLGWRGAATVAALMLLVRPANILVGTWGSGLELRERAFLAWLAPRGIVAAGVASLFAQSLDAAGREQGNELRALVFLVIATTVLVQGLTGGWVAALLGVKRSAAKGWAILGANDLGRALGRRLQASGEDVVFLDSSAEAVAAAEQEGFRVFFGSALTEAMLLRARVEDRAAVMAVTPNDEVNLLFTTKARREYRVPKALVALRTGHVSVTPKMVEEIGAEVLFGRPRSVDLWTLRIERKAVTLETWERISSLGKISLPDDPEQILLPLTVERAARERVISGPIEMRPGDRLRVLVFTDRAPEGHAWLREQGLVAVEEVVEETPS